MERSVFIDPIRLLRLGEDEDHQEEQFSLYFISVVVTLQSPNELPEAPSESRKIFCFWTALEEDEHPTLEDILGDIDNRVSYRHLP